MRKLLFILMILCCQLIARAESTHLYLSVGEVKTIYLPYDYTSGMWSNHDPDAIERLSGTDDPIMIKVIKYVNHTCLLEFKESYGKRRTYSVFISIRKPTDQDDNGESGDDSGGSTGADNTIEINSTNFPDTNFRNYLLSQSYGADGKLTNSECSYVWDLDIENLNISDLKGIEYFTMLQKLYCSYNNLTSLDLSNNKFLKSLGCVGNKLTSLNISRNESLINLYCDNNLLSNINVYNNRSLESLSCSKNLLTSIDLSRNTKLSSLNCVNNQLISLNVSTNTELKRIYLYQNQIKGAGMDDFVNSLPFNESGEFKEIQLFNTLGPEGNVCTKEQVDVAKAKKWSVFNSQGNYYHGSDASILVTSIDLNIQTLSLSIGESKQLTASVSPDNATDKSVTWSSSNTSVATVNSTGLVTANKEGSATITCKANDGSGKQATCDVTVKSPTIYKLTLSANPSGGSVNKGTTVYLTTSANGSKVSGADIYYTTNGGTPTKSSTKYTSSGIVINESCTLKAIAYKDGYETSDVGSWIYTIASKPKLTLSASPSGGSVESGTKVYLTAKADGTAVSGVDIYYTTNGTTPTNNSTKYTSSGITISQDCTLKAIAYKEGYDTSDVLTMSYSIKAEGQIYRQNGNKVILTHYNSMVLKEDGSLWICGKNEQGQVGDGTTTDKTTFVKVLDDVVNAEINEYGTSGYTFALKKDGTLWGWGQRGIDLGLDTRENITTPVKIMEDVFAFSEDRLSYFAIKNDGSLWMWGDQVNTDEDNVHGTWYYNTPIKIMDNVMDVKAEDASMLAIKKDNTLWGFGYNNSGQLGDGTKKTKLTPVKIMDNVRSVIRDYHCSFMIKKDKSLWACGLNDRGQLGDGTNVNKYSPVKIMENVDTVFTTNRSTFILKDDASLWACGDNYCGRLGDGTIIDKYTPIKIMDDVLQVSTTGSNTYFLKKDGKLYGCGSGLGLGDVITDNVLLPQIISDDVAKIACFDISSWLTESILFIKKDGTLWGLGYNGYGILGCGNTNYCISPPQKVMEDIFSKSNFELNTSSSGLATFYDSQSAYTIPNGLSAQVVTNVSNNKLTYKTIADGSVSGVIPAGTAVMLVSDSKKSGTFTLTAADNSTSYSGTNLLHGSDEATTTTGDGYHYKLSYGRSGSNMSDVFGWYWGAQNGAPFQIEAHKAWLVIPSSMGTRAYSADGDALGIDDTMLRDEAEGVYYDLQGRRIDKPTVKGVYIMNGKKITVK